MTTSPSMPSIEPDVREPTPEKVFVMEVSTQKVIHVAAAVIRDSKGRILIARRPDHAHQGGLWEFPGGKVEVNESVTEALLRELKEELDIIATSMKPLIKVRHDYPDKSVLLDVWEVDQFSGFARGNEGQPIAWVEPVKLPDFEFPAANHPIVTAAQLPRQLMITPDTTSLHELISKLEAATSSSVAMVMLRQTQWTLTDWQEYAPFVSKVCERLNVPLIINSAYKHESFTSQGLHFNAHELATLKDCSIAGDQFKEYRSQYAWLSVSCHNRDEVLRAETLGFDWALLSPVAATESHPEATPLGWEVFEAISEEAKIPLFALGGLGLQDQDRAIRNGAQGIAGIRCWLD